MWIIFATFIYFLKKCIFNKILRAKYYIVNILGSWMILNNSFFPLGLYPVIYLANRWTFFWWSLWMPWKIAALTLVLNTSMLIPFPHWYSEIGSFFAINFTFYGEIFVGPGLEFLCVEISVIIKKSVIKAYLFWNPCFRNRRFVSIQSNKCHFVAVVKLPIP